MAAAWGIRSHPQRIPSAGPFPIINDKSLRACAALSCPLLPRRALLAGRTSLPSLSRRRRSDPRPRRRNVRILRGGPAPDGHQARWRRSVRARPALLGDRNSLRAYDLASLQLHVGRRCRIRPNLRRCRNRGFQYLLQSCDIAGAAWTAPLPRPARALSQSCLKGSQLSGLQAPRSHAPSCSSSDGGADALRAAGHD